MLEFHPLLLHISRHYLYHQHNDETIIKVDYINEIRCFSCCDCGLVHTFEFDVKDYFIYIKIKRDNRRTGQKRRHKNYLKLVNKIS